ERLPQRPERNLVAVPETPPRPADVPVRQVVDERIERAHDPRRPVALVLLRDVGDELLGALDEPAVERLKLARRVSTGPKAVDVRVVDEELDRIPVRQQPAPDLRGRA